ncbi:unnamed protein product, partial [Mesorhabditis spiculigera]
MTKSGADGDKHVRIGLVKGVTADEAEDDQWKRHEELTRLRVIVATPFPIPGRKVAGFRKEDDPNKPKHCNRSRRRSFSDLIRWTSFAI